VEALEVVAMKLVDLARVEALEVVKMTLVELEVLALAVDSVKKKEKQKINLTQNANANNSWKLETSQLSHTLTTVKLPWLIE
jgi:predicted secreted protein